MGNTRRGHLGKARAASLRLGVLRNAGAPILFGLILLSAGCAGTGGSYIQPNVDFSRVHRCAVLPFENLSSDEFADDRIESIFITEVLRRGALALVDPEETIAAMQELRINPGSTPSPEQLVALGKALSVEALFLGTVEEYGQMSRSRQATYIVTASFSLVEAETGGLIWRSQVHADGSSIWKKLFGGESASLYEVSRQAVRKALGSLF